jgi:protein-S-isoprenylcysteine O-methyltransferase Ste14
MIVKAKDIIFVTCQLLLFILFLLNPKKIELHQSKFVIYVALVQFFFGLVILFWAVYELRKSISPFPSPKSNAQLIQTGVFKFIRHPIYTSIFLLTFGWALFSNSLFRFIIFVALVLLFELKSRYEEQLLIQKFPDYINYKKNTGKYFPKI